MRRERRYVTAIVTESEQARIHAAAADAGMSVAAFVRRALGLAPTLPRTNAAGANPSARAELARRLASRVQGCTAHELAREAKLTLRQAHGVFGSLLKRGEVVATPATRRQDVRRTFWTRAAAPPGVG